MEGHQDSYHIGDITDIDMRELSLHEVTGKYGVEGLRQQFIQLVDDLEIETDDKQSIILALEVGSIVHQGQKRGNHPYLTHLLRVSSRIIKHFDVSDPDIIKAALLHDSVEDQPGKFIEGVDSQAADDPVYQTAALKSIEWMFSRRVSSLISDVTNPQFDQTIDKAEQYRQYVTKAMAESPEARIIKLSDFLDNCKGLNYNELPLPQIKRLASKYQPLIPVMREYTCDQATPLTDHGRDYIITSLDKAEQRCQEIMAKE